MRALRSTVYVDPYEPPATLVLLEEGANDTLESCQHRVLTPGVLVITEIFEIWAKDADLERATVEAMQRQQANAEEEAHQAMLYFWVVAEWGRVKPPGALVMDKPAPMSHEAYAVVLSQLAQHPDRPANVALAGCTYDSHGLILPAFSNEPIVEAL